MRLIAILVVGTLAFATAASAGAPTYGGGSLAGHGRFRILLSVDGSVARWEVDYMAPCGAPSEEVGRTIGTVAQPPAPPLTIRSGSFAVTRHVVDQPARIDQRYSLAGHRVRGGWVGTFKAVEHDNGYTCATGLQRWHATPTQQPFP